jgi:nucleoside-diphosphate-sugar epimerase
MEGAKMRIGIYGHQGFVGSTLLSSHHLSGHDVYPIHRHMGVPSVEEIDVIINCAGNSQRFLAYSNMEYDLLNTIQPVIRLVERNKFHRFIQISSVDANGALDRTIGTRNPYGISKALADKLVRQYCTHNSLIIRPTSLLGAGMKKGVLYDMLTGKPVYLNPSSCLQFVTVNELAKFIRHMLENKPGAHDIITFTGTGNVGVHELEHLTGNKCEYAQNLHYEYYHHSPNTEKYGFRLKTSYEYAEETVRLWKIFKGGI